MDRVKNLLDLVREIRFFEWVGLFFLLPVAGVSYLNIFISDIPLIQLLSMNLFMGCIALSALIVWKSCWRLLERRVRRLEYKYGALIGVRD